MCVMCDVCDVCVWVRRGVGGLMQFGSWSCGLVGWVLGMPMVGMKDEGVDEGMKGRIIKDGIVGMLGCWDVGLLGCWKTRLCLW